MLLKLFRKWLEIKILKNWPNDNSKFRNVLTEVVVLSWILFFDGAMLWTSLVVGTPVLFGMLLTVGWLHALGRSVLSSGAPSMLDCLEADEMVAARRAELSPRGRKRVRQTPSRPPPPASSLRTRLGQLHAAVPPPGGFGNSLATGVLRAQVLTWVSSRRGRATRWWSYSSRLEQ